ncbi:DUF5658 family protein [Candidatus Bathyarchaeota archaeon]|nr:DUF5658 family protein [Candidatus Bathyarchaeota archaeon]
MSDSDWVILLCLFLFILNILDVVSTQISIAEGVGVEANKFTIFLWKTIGFSSTLVLKLGLPIGLFVWNQFVLYEVKARQPSAILVAHIVVFGCLVIEISVYLAVVLNNLAILFT